MAPERCTGATVREDICKVKQSNMTISMKLLLIVLSSLISVAAVYVVTWLSDYEIGDVSGMVYVVIAAPLIGLIVGILLRVLRRTLFDATNILLGVVIFTVCILLFHWVALQTGWIGGWYKLPSKSVGLMRESDSDLRRLLEHQNENIREITWVEFVRRAQANPKLLIEYVEAQKRIDPQNYIDYNQTYRAVTALAEIKAPQAIPYLNDMLASNRFIIITKGTSKIMKFNSRIVAKRLLKEYYGIETTVPTEQPV